MLTFIVLLATTSTAAEGWKVGVARVDITPQESIWLAGYASRKRRQKVFGNAFTSKPSRSRIAPVPFLFWLLPISEAFAPMYPSRSFRA